MNTFWVLVLVFLMLGMFAATFLTIYSDVKRRRAAEAEAAGDRLMFAVFTMATGGGFSVLFQGTLADCKRFEIDYAGCWLNGMRIAPITDQ